MLVRMMFSKRLLFSYFIIVIYLKCVKSADLFDLFTNRLVSDSKRNDISDELQVVKFPTNNTPVIQLIRSYNYPAETHEVITEDGYILNIQRIPKTGKPVVLFCHGLLGTSAYFLLQGPKKDLPFLLWDEDYDIWLMNLRGSIYSRQHIDLDPDRDKKFWDFSIHEMAIYDVPATVDYILNVTKQKSLTYVGHSMGCAVFFLMTSMKPEYNNKIKLMQALSPGGYIHQASDLVKLVYSNWPRLTCSTYLGILQSFIYSPFTSQQFFKQRNIYELMPLKKGLMELGSVFCNSNAPTQNLCFSIIFLIVGEDYQQANGKVLEKLLRHLPGGTAVNVISHIYQVIKTGHLQPLDLGPAENKRRYGSEQLLDYNLQKSIVPTMLYYGNGDYLITKEDTLKLASRLANVIDIYEVPFPKFNHLDFVFANDAKSLLYDQVILITNKYRNL